MFKLDYNFWKHYGRIIIFFKEIQIYPWKEFSRDWHWYGDYCVWAKGNGDLNFFFFSLNFIFFLQWTCDTLVKQLFIKYVYICIYILCVSKSKQGPTKDYTFTFAKMFLWHFHKILILLFLSSSCMGVVSSQKNRTTRSRVTPVPFWNLIATPLPYTFRSKE